MGHIYEVHYSYVLETFDVITIKRWALSEVSLFVYADFASWDEVYCVCAGINIPLAWKLKSENVLTDISVLAFHRPSIHALWSHPVASLQ